MIVKVSQDYLESYRQVSLMKVGAKLCWKVDIESIMVARVSEEKM